MGHDPTPSAWKAKMLTITPYARIPDYALHRPDPVTIPGTDTKKEVPFQNCTKLPEWDSNP